MYTNERLDESITGWLEQAAPARLPDRVLEATFERTRTTRQQVGWRARLGRIHVTRSVAALGGVAAVVVVAATLTLGSVADRPGIGGPLSSDDPRNTFLGTWFSTSDADGGTQTMIARATLDGGVEIVVTDDVASVCSRTPSTMTGTGRLEGDTTLVIPAPVYACDNGSEPDALSGPPLQEQLRNLTFVRDAQADVLTVGATSVWTREVAVAPSPAPQAWDTMWPQTSLEELQQAQRLADAGDAKYTWQVGARIVDQDPYTQVDAELVDRFLREALGWESWEFVDGGVFSDWAGTGDGSVEGSVSGQQYLRCAAGGPNPLYPDASCAPTLDEFRYETVSFDMAQLARQGRDGIWVVTEWRPTAPFTQTDPSAAEADARRRIEAFLAARVAGSGAERDVFIDDQHVVPLRYATTSGARYERYELERVEGPDWPDGRMVFLVRLVADGGATVVEQQVSVQQGSLLWVLDETTTENGRPVPLPHVSPDGAVSVTAPATWQAWLNGTSRGTRADDVWFGALWRAGDFFGGEGDQVELTDPVAFDAWCASQGGSPLLSGPAGAAEIAQQVTADPRFETTAPTAARVGGLNAVSMDVTLAPGAESCPSFGIEISRWVHGVAPGERLRLYLVDLPEGMPVRTLAVTIVATQDRFDDVIAETTPIIESIQFHPGVGTTSPPEVP